MTTEYELYKYQKDVVEYGKVNPYFINAMEQGTGKTPVTIVLAKETNSKLLIVCPSYMKLKWKKDVHKFWPEAIVSLFESAKDFYTVFDTDVVIISYAFLEKAELFFSWCDFVAFDEAQFLKNMKAKRTEAAHRYVYEYSVKRVDLLTGTPLENRVYELYSLIAICNYNPEIEESAFLNKFPTYVDFANHFSFLEEFEMPVKGKTVKVQQWDGYKNIDELKQWLKGIYYRVEADKVLDLPPFIDVDIPVEYKDYPELQAEFEKFSSDGESSVQSPVKIKAAMAKAQFTVDFAKDLIEKGLQVVIYSDHPTVAQAISDGLGLRYQAISGQTPMHVRQAQCEKFQAGEMGVLCATIGSLSTGVDLFASAHMIFNDPCWKPGGMKQVKSRIRRIGQKQRCTYYHMIGSYQDEYIYKRLAEKQKVIDAVI